MENENLNYNPSLDEIVFEHRNKEYGAYDLRSSYRRILTRSMIIGTLIFCIAAITPFVVMKIKQLAAKEKTEVDANLIEILPEEQVKEEIVEKEETPPPPPPKVEEKIEILQNVVPEPVKAPKVETPPPPISEQLKTTTGLINQEGVKQTAHIPPPVQAPPKAAAVESKAPSTTEVYESVDQEAEFPGSLNSFRNKIAENFDNSAMEGGEGTLKATVTFIVERDGSISDVKASGSNSDFNSEAVRTVKSIRTKWVPAKINGQPVRQRFRLPLTMNFE
ncbi:energy transducer TonB [Cloacibacterium normanense]|jgi:protein TonB|uniref:Gram-negative bacterial tonB family protein n=1 Tax=Cloacibacterium normanense TaxID=237258 RepID=A0A1E5UFJ3_9FLAO|nr:energy transducer TonB [Cloacibacterium normanense]AZI68426.1 energy transducer TonB [Cloacibacterium normanense]OEL11567.1 gram-negative bacterial tonB family protein [Cloacibacterium normanense]SDO71854.1 protein TonB [Cloacibacterium normanense]